MFLEAKGSVWEEAEKAWEGLKKVNHHKIEEGEANEKQKRTTDMYQQTGRTAASEIAEVKAAV